MSVQKNINILKYLLNIDHYIIDLIEIIKKKKQKQIEKELIIEKKYKQMFQYILNQCTIKNTQIISNQQIYSKFWENNLFIQHNSENNSILLLTYIINQWNQLADNIAIIDKNIVNDENNFPIEIYLIPKKNINLLINNYDSFRINNNTIQYSKIEKKRIKYKSNLNYKQWFEKYIQQNIPNNLYWCPNIFFSVSKQLIQKKGRKFFINIYNSIQNKYSEEIIFIERSWYYILKESDE